jgi:nitrite reductase/ring-hydroxylating ferredoxin subunit
MMTKSLKEASDVNDLECTRRSFCAQATLATCGAAVGLILQACGGGSSPTAPGHSSLLPTITGTRATGGVTIAIDSNSPLAGAGTAALVQSPAGNFLVAHTGGDTFLAVSAVCTHQACTITNVENQTYVCPCHGSTFDQNGRVLGGPALTSLRQYAAQFADGILTIAA